MVGLDAAWGAVDHPHTGSRDLQPLLGVRIKVDVELHFRF